MTAQVPGRAPRQIAAKLVVDQVRARVQSCCGDAAEEGRRRRRDTLDPATTKKSTPRPQVVQGPFMIGSMFALCALSNGASRAVPKSTTRIDRSEEFL